jgi:uncharacterized protein YPO0396
MFTDVSALQRRQQYRMRRLQVLNWGTFSNLHDIAIAEDGFLFVGRSGSGKSTLLDALAALLVPPQWLAFNAAAREGDRGRRDRNFASYVRGAWGEQTDAGSGAIANRFLRNGTTWSALALTFANSEGRRITLVQLYWLKGAAVANNEVKRHYMIAERAFDIARELADFDLDIRVLKNRLSDVDHFGDTFRPYSERFRRLLGIDTEMALKLLHKTQSAKNLGDLNSFLREFMLDEPESFKVAERLVAEFAELDAAHQEVVTARRQVDILRPARTEHERMRETDALILERRLLVEGIDAYCDGVRIDLLDRELNALWTREQGLEGERRQAMERAENLRATLRELDEQHRQSGGLKIEELESKRREAEARRDERLGKRAVVEEACRLLGWQVPDNAHLFSERVGEARGEVEGWQARQQESLGRRDTLRDELKEKNGEFAEVRREVTEMERRPSSNIPAHMLEMRQSIAGVLGIAETELPFVGELIQVREDAVEWRGAIERVLRSFAMSLLVDERRYAAVSNYVNDTNLGTRLVYYKVGDSVPVGGVQPRPHSLFHKLELKETTFQHWLDAELRNRFDYACVENMRDFRQEPKALTRQGQVKHGPGRHEKDDRSSVNDRRRWVLGFDNLEKLSLYRTRGRELADQIAELDRQLRNLQGEEVKQRERYTACIRLTNLEWQDIDVGSMLDRIHEIGQQIRELREGNRELLDLGKKIEKQRHAVQEAENAIREKEVEQRTIKDKQNELSPELASIKERLTLAVQPDSTHREILHQLFADAGELTLKNLDERRRHVERGLNSEIQGLNNVRADAVKRMERAFAEFKREWPQDGANLDATIESATEFVALLQRIESDGLPQHEQRFFDLLREQSTENLAALNAHLLQARKDIHSRMETVNEGLGDAEFNPGTYLRIDTSDRHLEDVQKFREDVRQVLGQTMQMDREGAEKRFLALRQLVKRLASQELEDRRWRELVLDVRQHVEFIGRELDAQGNEVEIYRSGAGKSGGQREKLATTCLAAALRYQLGGADGGGPVYAPVVLDEAFGKADNEFTELAMRIFEKFGFQMIVATPLKSVMTLEPFIGGACFVEIAERKRSATLPIEYDNDKHRLRLAAHSHGEDTPA